jgi:SAM-dependent methyltransferase
MRPINTLCRLCGGSIDTTAAVREMMFGTREPFDYHHCGRCGCWQIADYPGDMSRHYPTGYLSHVDHSGKPVSALKNWQRRQRARYDLLGTGVIGKWLSRWRGPLQFGAEWMQGFNLDFNSRILEFGCGLGGRLHELRDVGFTNLTGQDAFAIPAVADRAGIQWTSQPLSAIAGPYDWIEAHHAFEHMPFQNDVMQQLHRLLRPGGGLTLRVPLSDSEPVSRFGTHWVQWDAPRHFYLHTRRSLTMLAERHGFALTRVIEEGNPFGFWGSWLYEQDIALLDPRIQQNGVQSLVPEALWQQFIHDNAVANANARGDQAVFVFRRL